MPVPEAETIPTDPLRTTFPKPRTTPLMIEVPQSGPITSRPLAFAASFSSTSSSRGTLLLKRKTSRPLSRAFIASLLANRPGMDMRARFASDITLTAEASDLGRISSAFMDSLDERCRHQNGRLRDPLQLRDLVRDFHERD